MTWTGEAEGVLLLLPLGTSTPAVRGLDEEWGAQLSTLCGQLLVHGRQRSLAPLFFLPGHSFEGSAHSHFAENPSPSTLPAIHILSPFLCLGSGVTCAVSDSHPFFGLQTSVLGVSLSTIHESWSTALGRLTLPTAQTHYTKETQVLLTPQALLTPSRNH